MVFLYFSLPERNTRLHTRHLIHIAESNVNFYNNQAQDSLCSCLVGIQIPFPKPWADSTLTFPYFHTYAKVVYMCIISLLHLITSKSSRILGSVSLWFPNKFTWTSILYTAMHSSWPKKVRTYMEAHILLVIYILVPIILQIPPLWSCLHSLLSLGMAWPHRWTIKQIIRWWKFEGR